MFDTLASIDNLAPDARYMVVYVTPEKTEHIVIEGLDPLNRARVLAGILVAKNPKACAIVTMIVESVFTEHSRHMRP